MRYYKHQPTIISNFYAPYQSKEHKPLICHATMYAKNGNDENMIRTTNGEALQ